MTSTCPTAHTGAVHALPPKVRQTTIMSEFNEMPGMRLTLAQAARLWSLAIDDCRRMLDDLVRAGFLMVDEHARYARRADRVTRARPEAR